MRAESVAREDRVDEARLDEPGHGVSRVLVKGKGGTHDPDDLAMLALVVDDVHQLTYEQDAQSAYRALLG